MRETILGSEQDYMLSTNSKRWWPSCTYWSWYNSCYQKVRHDEEIIAIFCPLCFWQFQSQCSGSRLIYPAGAVVVVADKLFTISRWSEAQSHNTCQWQWKIFRKQCFPTSTYYQENQFPWTWIWSGHHSEKELYSKDKYSVVRVMFWWCNQSFLWPLNENLRRQVTVT